MSALADGLILFLIAVGCFFTLLGAFSLIKLTTFFQRIHGPTKASTLGVGCILIASIGYHQMYGVGLHPRELLITVFLFLTAPVSAHMMAKAALSLMPESERPPQPRADDADTRTPQATHPDSDERQT